MTRALRQLTAGCALALVAGTGLTASPAGAATGSPPTTANDTASMFAGNVVFVDVLENDTDPDGDDLAVCRIGESPHRSLDPIIEGDELVIFSSARTKPGTYTFTYYACDFSYLTAGTVTLTIEPEPNITVKKIPSRPGKLKVKNPADFRIEVLFGSFRAEAPDGEVSVRRNSSRVITVHRHKIGWIAFSRDGEFLKIGRVNDITLPPGDQPPAAGRLDLSPRMATTWRAQ